MPEGDTIHNVALAMRPLVVGAPLAALHLPTGDVGLAEGTAGRAVEAHGKHLLISFAAPDAPLRMLRVHLGMNGEWHRYRVGERWRRSPRDTPHVALTAGDWVLVCFQPAQCVLYDRARDLARDPAFAGLGPDLLDPATALPEVLARARAPEHADRAVADVLLDQRVAAGIGNVYKSEVLFIERVDPFRALRELSDETLSRLYERAVALLSANVGGGPRVTAGSRAPFGQTSPGGLRHWVYRRAGRPCPRCRTPIRSAPQGPQVRMTYWCPRCQR